MAAEPLCRVTPTLSPTLDIIQQVAATRRGLGMGSSEVDSQKGTSTCDSGMGMNKMVLG